MNRRLRGLGVGVLALACVTHPRETEVYALSSGWGVRNGAACAGRARTIMYKKKSRVKQQELMRLFEEKKESKEQRRRVDDAQKVRSKAAQTLVEGGGAGGAAGEGDDWLDGSMPWYDDDRELGAMSDFGFGADGDVRVNQAWRAGSSTSTTGDADASTKTKAQAESTLRAQFDAAMRDGRGTTMSHTYTDRAMSVDALEDAHSSAVARGAMGMVSYLRPRELAPLEVWNGLVDLGGGAVQFGAEGIGRDNRVVVVVTHFRESSRRLKKAVEAANAELPRKLPVDLVVVTRDSQAANKKLTKNARLPMKVLSAAGPGGEAWCLAHGQTSQLASSGLTVFMMDSKTKMVLAVNYDCDELGFVDYVRGTVAKILGAPSP